MSRSICRVCLRTDVKIKDIDDELVNFHDEITAFSIYENKALKYCTACEYLLKKFYNFCRKCVKANNILKEYKLQKKTHFPNDLHKLLPTTLSSCITSTINQFNLVNGYLQPHSKQEPDSDFSEIPEVTTVKVPPDNQRHEFSSYDVEMSNDSLFYQNKNEYKVTLSEMTGVDFEDENDPSEHINLGDSKRIQDSKVKLEKNELKVKQEYRDKDMSDNDLEEDSSDKEIIFVIEELNDDSSSKTDKTKKKKRFKAKPRAKGPLKNRQEYEQVFDIQVFESEQDAINELEGRKTEEPFLSAEHKCDICYTVYKHAKLLAFHKNWHHPSRGDAECEVCRMRFRNKRAVDMHKYGSHYGKFKCKKCPMVTYHKMAMQTHYKLHAGELISCKLCDYTFNHPSTYKSHLRLRHETVHICVSCARTFVSEKGLLAHRNIKHKTQSMTDSDATARCEPCGVTFKNEQIYIVHVKNSERHSELAKTITACKLCGVTVEHHSDLKEHTRTHHPARRRNVASRNVASRNADQYKCSICGLVGPSRSVCKHIVEKHPDSSYVADLTKRRKHMCDKCGKCYVNEYILRDHLNTHTGAKPYACASCPARFTSRANLKFHGEWHAPAKRECKHCGKKYRTASALSNHIRSHIQDRRYKCTICHKGFYHASTLREHVSGVHNHQRRVRKLVKREAVSHES